MIPVKYICVLIVLFSVCNGEDNSKHNATETQRQGRVNHQMAGSTNTNFCTGNNQQQGVCLNRMACSKSGGTQIGFGCGAYSVCCSGIKTLVFLLFFVSYLFFFYFIFENHSSFELQYQYPFEK